MASFAGRNAFDEPTTLWDQAAFVVVDALFSGKFNSLFSMLFAVGFAIQLERLEQRAGSEGRWIYVRRLLVLFAIGIAHAVLVWDGDVLHMYALLGFVLLLLRNASDRTLLVLAAFLLLYPGLRSLALVLYTGPEWTATRLAPADGRSSTATCRQEIVPDPATSTFDARSEPAPAGGASAAMADMTTATR